MTAEQKQFFQKQTAAWLTGYVDAHIDLDIDQFWFARLIHEKLDTRHTTT